jgi:hypothetical protein
LAFISGTTYNNLVQEQGHNCPKTVDELMDVVANYVAGEEAVRAFFNDGKEKGKVRADDVETPSKGPNNSNNKKKKA